MMNLFKKNNNISDEKTNHKNVQTGKIIDAERGRLYKDYSDSLKDICEVSLKDMDSVVSKTSIVAQNLTDNVNEILNTNNKLNNIKDATIELTNKANKTSNNMAEDLTNLHSAIEKNVNKINSYCSRIEEASKSVDAVVKKLIDNAHKTSNMINKLEDVTSEVTLLSLNASIEAVRAGEAGKGFVVVAEEINQLAQATKECTDVFKTSIAEINQDANNAGESITSELKSLTDEGKEVGGTIENLFKNITTAIKENVTVNKDVNSDLLKNNDQLLNITADLNKAVGSLTENMDTVNDVCEVQMNQTNNLYESLDLSKKLLNMTNEDM